MDDVRSFPTLAKALLAAGRALRVPDEIGLALRAHRRMLGLSQRAYAEHRGWGRSRVGRLETQTGRLKLDDIVEALADTPFRLYLGPAPSHPHALAGHPLGQGGDGPLHVVLDDLPSAIDPSAWSRADLSARDRSGRRRRPRHWYAPVTPLRPAN